MEPKTKTSLNTVRSNLSADIMEEAGQEILMRDNLTLMTATAIIENQSIQEL